MSQRQQSCARGSRGWLVAICLAQFFAIVPATGAQLRPISLGLAGGTTVPSGRLDSSLDRGYHGLVTLRVGFPVLPLHVRADVMHGQFAAKSPGGTDLRLTSVSGNLGYDIVPLGLAAVYAVGGAGYYWTDDASGGTRTRTTGWNAGAGIRLSLGSVRLFGEARYHSTSTASGDARFVPVTIGVLF